MILSVEILDMPSIEWQLYLQLLLAKVNKGFGLLSLHKGDIIL
jgi:hypothetical protein